MSEKSTSGEAAAKLNISARRSSNQPSSNAIESRCLIAAIVYIALLLDNVLLTVIGNANYMITYDKS